MAKKSTFEGFGELSNKLLTMADPKQTGKVLAAGVRKALNEVKGDARANMPKGIDPHRSYKGRLLTPGFASRSLRVILKKDKSGEKVVGVLGVRAEAFYAVQFVELGTSKMAARPWLRPAFSGNKDPSIASIGDGMRDWLLDLARRHAAAGQSARAAQLRLGAGDV